MPVGPPQLLHQRPLRRLRPLRRHEQRWRICRDCRLPLPTILLALLLPAPAWATDAIQGVFVYPSGAVQVIATLPGGNVVGFADDAATSSYAITLNGQTIEVPQAGTLGIAYRGGAGGGDYVTQGCSLTVSLELFTGSNTLTTQSGGRALAYLFGPGNTVDAATGYVDAYVYGGTGNTYAPSANVGLITNSTYYSPSAIPGIFASGSQYVETVTLVSPLSAGNHLTMADDAGVLSVTENGQTVTFSETATTLAGLDYYGSWGGSDAIDDTSSIALTAYLYGNGDMLDDSGTGSLDAYLAGNDDDISGTIGDVFVNGSGETITGGVVTQQEGAAPVTAPPAAGTTGTATTSTSSTGASTSATTAGGTAGAAGASSGGGCGVGAGLGLVAVLLARQRRRLGVAGR